jgi:predicted nucleic acid-binding protein
MPVSGNSPIYWDTSALLKCYAPEPDSAAYRSLLGNRPVIAICFMHRLEMAYALRQKEIRGEILPKVAGHLTARFDRDADEGRFMVLPWGPDVAQAARDVLERCVSASEPVAIRTLDGIHLAAARLAGIRDIVSTDRRMRAAAETLALNLGDP